MANQTVSVNRNLDDAAILGLANGEDLTINTGAVLTINSDSRYGQQAAVIGAITIDSGTGGQCLIDGRDVWEIPFSAATGNVPVLGTANVYDCTGGTSGSQGEFLGIWTDREQPPLASGGAIPASGILKLRRKSAAFTGGGEVITLPGGATVTADNGGRIGWLAIVGEGLTNITVPRLGQFRAYGAWYDLGLTDGTDNQIIKFYSLDICPAIEIETAPGSGIFEEWLNAGITRWAQAANRVSTDSRGKMFGQGTRFTGTTSSTVNPTIITGIADTSQITIGSRMSGTGIGTNAYVTAKDATTITVSVACTASGTVTLIAVNEKLMLARRIANSCGYKPPAGCQIRVPNVHVSNAATSPGFNRDLFPSSTVGDRWEFITTSAGDVEISIISGNWYLNLAQASRVVLTSVFTTDQIRISECASAPEVTDCAVGLSAAVDAPPLSLSSLFFGLELTRGNYLKYECETGDVGMTLTDVSDAVIVGSRIQVFGDNTAATLTRGASVYALTLTRCLNCTFTDMELVGAGVTLTSCVDCLIEDLKYADGIEGRLTSSSSGVYAVNITGGCQRVTVRGTISNLDGLANVHPYAGLVAFTASYDCVFEDVATPASPWNAGTSSACGLMFALLGNNQGHIIRNVYGFNLRTGVATDTNADSKCVAVNVWGDGADVFTANALSYLRLAGLRSTNPTTGATSVYGTHFYDTFVSATEPRLLFLGNEPNALTGTKLALTGGTPKFTATGQIKLVTIGDEVTFEMDYFLRGWLSFANAAPTISGTNTGNHIVEYQTERMVDGVRSGWSGVWLTANAANLFAETIPAYVSESNPGGIRLKLRVRCTTAAATNAIINVRITGVTDAATYVRAHPKAYADIALIGVETGSIAAIFDATGGIRADSVESGGNIHLFPTWDADYPVTIRVRKAGWAPARVDTTIPEVGLSATVDQIDWTGVADTDPGALGITVTNHGATPVSWQGKDWSITVATTNDALTAAEIVQYLSWNIARMSAFNGFIGMAWPTLALPNSTGYETERGELYGSAGAALKGVRVVRNDGTTAVIGFSRMQSDDGSYWIAPETLTISAPNLTTGTRVWLYNVTTDTVLDDVVLASPGYSYVTVNGGTITAGHSIELRAARIGYVRLTMTGASASSGLTFTNTQSLDPTYTAIGLNGAAVTGIVYTVDAVAAGIDALDLDRATDTISLQEIYAWLSYFSATSPGIARQPQYWSAVDQANFTTPDWLKMRNVKSSPTLATTVTDGYLQSQTSSESWIASNWLQSVQGRGFLAGGEALTQVLTYDGNVRLQLDSGISGTSFPIGTLAAPVNNLADALVIAEANGIHTLRVEQNGSGATMLSITQATEGYEIQRAAGTSIIVVLSATYSINRTTFQEVIITGTANPTGEWAARTTRLVNVTGVAGVFIETQLSGTVGIRSSTNGSTFSRCATLGAATLDCGSDAAVSAVFSDFVGDLTVTNLVAGAVLVFDSPSARITLAASCTGGTVIVRGDAIVVNNGAAAVQHYNDSSHAVIDKSIDGTTDLTLIDAQRIMLAFIAGKLDIEDLGGGIFRYSYRNPADTKNRIIGTVRTSDGDRTAVSTLDVS